jgi:hypothetical protein
MKETAELIIEQAKKIEAYEEALATILFNVLRTNDSFLKFCVKNEIERVCPRAVEKAEQML